MSQSKRFSSNASFLVLALSLAIACSPTSKKVMLDGGPAEGGAGQTQKGELPGGYEARIRCGDLGASCKDDGACAGDLDCVIGTCLPRVPEQTSECSSTTCPREKPLCVSQRCVTPDQLGCLCLNPHSREIISECRSITSSASGCTSESGLCDGDPSSCCTEDKELSCVRGDTEEGEQLLGLCLEQCDKDADCKETGCCAEVPSLGHAFCGPVTLCQSECRELREECDGTTGRRPCCSGLLCTKVSSDDALAKTCQQPCKKSGECDTGCCVLFSGENGEPLDHGVCLTPDRCK